MTFKIGDRVRRTQGNNGPLQITGYIGTITDVTDAYNPRKWLHFADGSRGLDSCFELAPIMLEEGKFYKTRDGQKVGPAKLSEYPSPDCKWSVGTSWLYQENGVCGSTFPKNDIVAEWPFQIEAGKTYLSDTGAKVGPMVRTHERHDEIYFVNQQIGRWRLDGAAFSDSRPDLGNLVSEWVEPLKIEAGKYYCTADGRVFGTYGQPDGNIAMVGTDYKTCRFLGGTLYADCRPHADNLVGEVPAPAPVGPIREVTETVTRTEIVPGKYSGVHVDHAPANGFVTIELDRSTFEADELDAAADVFKKLAKVLRNV